MRPLPSYRYLVHLVFQSTYLCKVRLAIMYENVDNGVAFRPRIYVRYDEQKGPLFAISVGFQSTHLCKVQLAIMYENVDNGVVFNPHT